MLRWLRRFLCKPKRPLHSPTNYLIGDLVWIARRTPKGQRVKKIRETLAAHDYTRSEVWRK